MTPIADAEMKAIGRIAVRTIVMNFIDVLLGD
jgi:hypothetical protein